MYLLHSFTGVLRGSISVFVDEELTQTDRLTAVWGHMLTQLSGSMVVMSPQRGVFRGKSVFWGVGWWRWWCGEGRGGDGTGNYWLVASSIITVEPSAVKYTTWPREPQADQGRRNSSTQPHTHAKANTGRLLLSWLCDIRLIICIASKIRVTEKKAKNRQGKKKENNRILELVCESWEENVSRNKWENVSRTDYHS